MSTQPIPQPAGPPDKLLQAISQSVYELHFRNRFKPTMGHIVAKDIRDAREKGQEYCKKFNLRFISVTPFFVDLSRNPLKSPNDTEDET